MLPRVSPKMTCFVSSGTFNQSSNPNVSQYPPTGYPPLYLTPGYPPQYPPSDAYGQPMAAAYPPPGYGAFPYGQQPQNQQQQQVVVVNGGQPQPIIYRQAETFIGQMILACFVLWCCNCLFGLIAFILAGEPKQKTSFRHSAKSLYRVYAALVGLQVIHSNGIDSPHRRRARIV